MFHFSIKTQTLELVNLKCVTYAQPKFVNESKNNTSGNVIRLWITSSAEAKFINRFVTRISRLSCIYQHHKHNLQIIRGQLAKIINFNIQWDLKKKKKKKKKKEGCWYPLLKHNIFVSYPKKNSRKSTVLFDSPCISFNNQTEQEHRNKHVLLLTDLHWLIY